jgi:hypothetical protein
MEKVVDGIGHRAQHAGQHVDDETDGAAQRFAESFEKTFYLHAEHPVEGLGIWPYAM